MSDVWGQAETQEREAEKRDEYVAPVVSATATATVPVAEVPKPKEVFGAITGAIYFSDPKYYTQDVQNYWRYSPDWDQNLTDEQNIANLRNKYYSLPMGMAAYSGVISPENYLRMENPNFDQVQKLAQAAGTNYPGFQEWLTQYGEGYQGNVFESDEYKAMQNLLAYFTGEDVAGKEAAVGEARNYAGTLMGFGEGGYEPGMQGLLQILEGGVAGQPGVSEEQKRTYSIQTQQEIRKITDETSKMVEALGGEGVFGRAFAKMDEARGTIANYAIQRDVALAEQEFARQQVEYNALSSRYELLVNKGGQYTTEYLGMLEQKKALGLQAYATNIQTILIQNAAYLNQYQADVDAISKNAQAAYNAVMATTQYEGDTLDNINKWWDTNMAPYLQDLEEDLSREALKVAGEAANAQAMSGIFAALGSILGVIFG